MEGNVMGGPDMYRQLIRSSGFPYARTLVDFDWSFQPSVPRPQAEELATPRFVDRAESVLLVGSPGVGNYAGAPVMLGSGP